jgi:hypothetical protein
MNDMNEIPVIEFIKIRVYQLENHDLNLLL